MDTGLLLFIAVAVVAFCLIAAGVFVLAGPGWALVSGGLSFLLAAGFIRKGLTGG